MADKVYQLYQENKEKELENRFIYDVFEVMVEKEPELKFFLTDIVIRLNDDKALGRYETAGRFIRINKELIKKQPVINHNFLAIEVIRHELEHARNLKTLYNGKEDIESLIIYFSLRDYAIKHGLDYYPSLDPFDEEKLNTFRKLVKENYKTNPEERMVEIKAWKYMVNMLKNQRISKDLLYARKGLFYSLARGYEFNGYYYEPPAYEFLLKIGMIDHLKSLKQKVKEKEYCLDTRLMYGLPITQREYDHKIIEKVKLRIIGNK